MKPVSLILLVLFLQACTKKILVEDTHISNEMIFLQNKVKPFTGKYIVVFHKTMQPKAVFTAKNGKLKGGATTFYQNGNKKWQGYYGNGLCEGPWNFFDQNGNLMYKVDFSRDSVVHVHYSSTTITDS
jgi:antitoxin component YwqK of YwqJK toxin-antitoxin module